MDILNAITGVDIETLKVGMLGALTSGIIVGIIFAVTGTKTKKQRRLLVQRITYLAIIGAGMAVLTTMIDFNALHAAGGKTPAEWVFTRTQSTNLFGIMFDPSELSLLLMVGWLMGGLMMTFSVRGFPRWIVGFSWFVLVPFILPIL